MQNFFKILPFSSLDPIHQHVFLLITSTNFIKLLLFFFNHSHCLPVVNYFMPGMLQWTSDYRHPLLQSTLTSMPMMSLFFSKQPLSTRNVSHPNIYDSLGKTAWKIVQKYLIFYVMFKPRITFYMVVFKLCLYM